MIKTKDQKKNSTMTQATIKDIAQKLGLSPSTVSRGLHDHPGISAKTKEQVRALAASLDYYPDSIAQSLQKRQTKTIGVIVPEIKHDFFASAISGIEELAYKAGYAIIVCQSNETFEREVINTRTLVSKRVDGLLISISQTTENGEHFKALQRRGVPIVFFDRVCEDVDCSKVVVDDHDGAFRAVEYLIDSGYKTIAHLAGPKNISVTRNRLQGYLDALKSKGIAIDENLIVHGGMNEEDGVFGFQKLLSLGKKPDAIFAVNDPVAIGVMIFAKEHSLKIPQDVAVVGFSNNQISSLIEPALTTVDQPSHEMGKMAVKLLLEQISSDKNGFSPKTEVLKTKLIIRFST